MKTLLKVFVSGETSGQFIDLFKEMGDDGYLPHSIFDTDISDIKILDRNTISMTMHDSMDVMPFHMMAKQLEITYMEVIWSTSFAIESMWNNGFAVIENGFKYVEKHIDVDKLIHMKFNDGSVQDVLGGGWESKQLLFEHVLRNMHNLKIVCDSDEPETFDVLYVFEDCIHNEKLGFKSLSESIKYAKDRNNYFWGRNGLEMVQVINNRNKAVEFEITL